MKNRKKQISKINSCVSVWKKRMIAEKGFSEKYAEEIAIKCVKLIERMSYGNAMIAFYRQDGTYCMEQGTLVGYEKFFHKAYQITPNQLSIIYWNMNLHVWRRFMIENLMEWKAIV